MFIGRGGAKTAGGGFRVFYIMRLLVFYSFTHITEHTSRSPHALLCVRNKDRLPVEGIQPNRFGIVRGPVCVLTPIHGVDLSCVVSVGVHPLVREWEGWSRAAPVFFSCCDGRGGGERTPGSGQVILPRQQVSFPPVECNMVFAAVLTTKRSRYVFSASSSILIQTTLLKDIPPTRYTAVPLLWVSCGIVTNFVHPNRIPVARVTKGAHAICPPNERFRT